MSVLSHLIPSKTDPVRVDHELEDGDVVAGLRVVHTPGHTAGHVSLLWESRRVLFVGDAFANMLNRARYGSVYEDLHAGKRSIATIAELDFDVAVFGHGTPVVGDAAARLRDRLARLAG